MNGWKRKRSEAVNVEQNHVHLSESAASSGRELFAASGNEVNITSHHPSGVLVELPLAVASKRYLELELDTLNDTTRELDHTEEEMGHLIVGQSGEIFRVIVLLLLVMLVTR